MIPPRIIRPRVIPESDGDLPEDIHPVICRVLLARGVCETGQLSLDMKDMLLPDELGGVEQAASLLADAVSQDQQVLIVGDFDADGATGTALAMLSLEAMGCRKIDFRVPSRFEFGYGLTVPLVDSLADDPPDLLITVDSGISCVDGVKRARELGCRVIVTDHHLPGEVLPAAHAIVNPNCAGDAFPSKAMAGVGVMFYLLSVVRRELRTRGWFSVSRPEPNLAHYLDLVALGTVADLVPLDHNNRVLVRQGLERIRRGLARPGLMALLRLGKRDYRFASSSDLGFAVGPRLNAAGRLEDMGTGIRCLLSDDPAEAMQEALGQVEGLLTSLERQELPPALCLFDESWHQGIVGLVASRVKDVVHRPVFAFAPESEGASVLKGSARSVKGLHIRDVLAYVDSHQPGLMKAFGGHAMAAGLTLDSERYPQFEKSVAEAVTVILDGAELSAELLTDGELFDGLFEVIESRVVGGSHLKMIVQSIEGSEPVDAIAFNQMPEDLPQSGAVRLLYRLGINRWRGNESCQLMVEEIVK